MYKTLPNIDPQKSLSSNLTIFQTLFWNIIDRYGLMNKNLHEKNVQLKYLIKKFCDNLKYK